MRIYTNLQYFKIIKNERIHMFKILLVEDDKQLNQTVCTYLNKNGFNTTGVLNVTDAYDEMYENVFDLI